MLNIFNLKLLQQYNQEKAAHIQFSNYRARINEQIKKKIKMSSIAKNINDNTALNMLINDYLKPSEFFYENRINSKLDKILANNDKFDKLSFSSEANFQTALEKTVENYAPYFFYENITRYTPTLNKQKSSSNEEEKDFIKFCLKKLAIFYLYFQFNEKEMTLLKAARARCNKTIDIEFEKRNIQKKADGLIIIPFLRQSYSHNKSLVLNNSNCFGNLSYDILTTFFYAPIDINPYNYKYWGQSASVNLQNTYTAQKFLEFINVFAKLIIPHENDKHNLEHTLQQEILELTFNINFIFFNAFQSPIYWGLKQGLDNYLDRIKDLSCRFYYNSTILPLPEYRILLSTIFNKMVHADIFANKEKHLPLTFAVDIFNTNIERLANEIIPNFLNSMDFLVYKNYTEEEILSELKDIWKATNAPKAISINNTKYTFNVPLFETKDYNILLPSLSEKITNIEIEPYNANIREEIIVNKHAEKAFQYLHELIFSALYFNKEKCIESNGIPQHPAPQINNYRIKKTEQDFTKWCRANKDKYQCLKNLNDF